MVLLAGVEPRVEELEVVEARVVEVSDWVFSYFFSLPIVHSPKRDTHTLNIYMHMFYRDPFYTNWQTQRGSQANQQNAS